MGKHRRKTTHFPKKRLPKIFGCPKCGKQSIIILMNRKLDDAVIKCGTCKLEDIVQLRPCDERVDAYHAFIDRFYSNTFMEITA